jgi:hypothetical protein
MRALRTLPILLLSLLIAFAACDRGKRVTEYGYVFQESTGENQYLVLESRRVPIKRFAATSDQKALKSLHALKWNILYLNAGGDRIFVIGEYDNQSQSFRLEHWYIKVPFQKLVIEDETHVPQKTHTVTVQSLERTDFESRNGFDPNHQAFDPTSYQRPQ